MRRARVPTPLKRPPGLNWVRPATDKPGQIYVAEYDYRLARSTTFRAEAARTDTMNGFLLGRRRRPAYLQLINSVIFFDCKCPWW